MKHLRVRTQKSMHRVAAPGNRRDADRVSMEFGLMYSAQDAMGELIMGDGTVTDISRNGLGIRGNAAVHSGMDLTLFLYLPDGQDPLFVMEAKVVWSAGRHFGVRLLKMNLRALNRLHYFLAANCPA